MSDLSSKDKCSHAFCELQVAALILENTFTSILDMAGVLLPFLKWLIGGSSSKGPRVLNRFVRSPWSTIDIVGEVKLYFWRHFLCKTVKLFP